MILEPSFPNHQETLKKKAVDQLTDVEVCNVQ